MDQYLVWLEETFSKVLTHENDGKIKVIIGGNYVIYKYKVHYVRRGLQDV